MELISDRDPFANNSVFEKSYFLFTVEFNKKWRFELCDQTDENFVEQKVIPVDGSLIKNGVCTDESSACCFQFHVKCFHSYTISNVNYNYCLLHALILRINMVYDPCWIPTDFRP